MVDEATDFQACQMLTDNAKNLSSAISEALCRTKSASLRVTKKVSNQLQEGGILYHYQ